MRVPPRNGGIPAFRHRRRQADQREIAGRRETIATRRQAPMPTLDPAAAPDDMPG